MNELLPYIGGFLFNLFIVLIIVRCIYYPSNPNKDNIFTYLGFSTVIYFVINLMTTIELSIGVGFGLFALFSVLRYRTETIHIRDMTYLFIIIATSLMNSIMISEALYLNAIIASILVIGVTLLLEKEVGFNFIEKKEVIYEKIDLIKANKREELIEDLQERLGIETIINVEIGNVNFLKDSTKISVYYKK
jgi:hypothetical protein